MTTQDHPSQLAFDLAVLGEAPPAFEAHLEACASCRAQRDARVAEQREFEQSTRPALAARAIAARLPSRRRVWLAGGAAAIALAAAVVLLVRARGGDDGVRLKGGALSIDTYVKRGDAAPYLLASGQALRAGDAVQLAVHGAASERVQVFHVDRACTVHLEASTLTGSDGLIPRSWRLDASGGDRLYVVVGDELDEARFAAALRGAPGGCDPTSAPELAGLRARGVVLGLEAP